MTETLILYFLSIKSTHGYEIQKFIQLNEMNDWTTIRSGSIYYALSKLEKLGHIVLAETIPINGKMRKVYAISKLGRQALKKSVKEQMNKNIYDVKSDKFIAYPFLKGLEKDEIIGVVIKHIENLRKAKENLEYWQTKKLHKGSLKIERLSFEMMIQGYENQIKWHQALIEEIDECLQASDIVEQLILQNDFSNMSQLTSHI